MKQALLTIAIIALFVSPSFGVEWDKDWALNILGGTDESAAIGIGKVFPDTKTEFGLSVLTGDNTATGQGWTSAIGPYVGMQAAVPGLDPGDAMSFIGGAAQMDVDTRNLVYTGFAGLLLNPQSQVSPVVMYRYNAFESGYNNAVVDRGSVWFAGLRFAF